MSFKALILEPEEVLNQGEEFAGTKTIQVKHEKGRSVLGFIGIVKNSKTREYHYVSLKATQYSKQLQDVI